MPASILNNKRTNAMTDQNVNILGLNLGKAFDNIRALNIEAL